MELPKSDNTYLSGGFDQPVFQTQTVFRAIMDAMAHPGTIYPVSTPVLPPRPLSSVAGAVICTLCDADTPIWLDNAFSCKPEIEKWISFQTDAPIAVSQKQASFALIGNPAQMSDFEYFALGNREYPETSATLIIEVEDFTGGPPLILCGPGIKNQSKISPSGLSEHFISSWRQNHAQFPCGVDLIFAGPKSVVCMPRSVQLIHEEN